jgi:hypothetical protein
VGSSPFPCIPLTHALKYFTPRNHTDMCNFILVKFALASTRNQHPHPHPHKLDTA